MKIRKLYILIFVLLFSFEIKAQEAPAKQERSIKKQAGKSFFFSNPTVPPTLIVENYQGNIHIEAYSGREVIIDTKENINAANYTQQVLNPFMEEQAFTVEEQNNTMTIKTKTSVQNMPINFLILVPEQTSLKLKITKEGEVKVSKTSRLVEVDNPKGSIKLQDLTGWAVVHTITGNIDASFSETIANKNMSFISLDGSINLSFPKNMQADIRMKSVSGNINNEFGTYLLQGNVTSGEQPSNTNLSQKTNVFREDEKLTDDLKKENAARGRDYEQNTLDRDKSDVQKAAKKKDVQLNENQKGKRAYISSQAFETKINNGGPIIFISTREGAIEIKKQK